MTEEQWRAAKQKTGEQEIAGEWLKSYFPATQVLLGGLLGVGWGDASRLQTQCHCVLREGKDQGAPWVSFLREHHCHSLITFMVLPINTSTCKISTPALVGDTNTQTTTTALLLCYLHSTGMQTNITRHN